MRDYEGRGRVNGKRHGEGSACGVVADQVGLRQATIDKVIPVCADGSQYPNSRTNTRETPRSLGISFRGARWLPRAITAVAGPCRGLKEPLENAENHL